MLGSTQPTAYDLNFALGRTRVSVHVSFWIFTAILGWNYISAGIDYLLIWIACVFVSILLHEFGHVWAGHLFGSEGDILLYSFGGLAIGASDQKQRWQRVIVYLSGPGVQLVLYGVLVGLRLYVIQDRIFDWPKHLFIIWAMLEQINLIWPLFNLLPVWPLDGGKISREFCEWLSPREGTRVSLGVSIAAAGFMAINSLLAMNKQPHVPYIPTGGLYMVLLFGMLAFESYQLLHLYRKPWDDDRQPWER
jgi:stage IV sporulation protein FB